MNTVKVRNLIIGEGMPKICVPVTGCSKEAIIEEIVCIKELPADLIEWRADWYEYVFDADELMSILKDIREAAENIPVLMTFRTRREGGEKDVDAGTYSRIVTRAISSGCIDLVDVELFVGDDTVSFLISEAHAAGVKVVASNHDFEKTPARDEIIARLCRMQAVGADISKIAVMPQSKHDVLTLLEATEEMNRRYADRPVIAISMGSDGLISRLAGEVFGSAVTFGAGTNASAPGQIRADNLKNVLNIIHGIRDR